jgi:protein-L-isoaspartate(D-aspartate) O-methyltransferase
MLPFPPQLLPEELRDQRVLDAMERIPRQLFVPEASREEAERDVALSIGFGQTISQPYIVAYMTANLGLSPGRKVLEVGTGSGYQTAVLAQMGVEVYSVELIPELSRRAEHALRELHLMDRVHLRIGDGRHGWAAHAPFDGILCTAAPLTLPTDLIEQARIGARLVVPVGPRDQQLLRVLERRADELVEIRHLAVRFVPLVRPEPEA